MNIKRVNDSEFDKIYVISDIHGNSKLLNEMLLKINLTKNDLLIIAGDSCDRGKNSSEVYEIVINLINDNYNVIHLKGNHEVMFYEYMVNNENYERWIRNGGNYTIDSYNNKALMDKHLEFISEMEYIIETDNYYIIHAGINPENSIENQIPRDLVWIRDEFINSKVKLNKKIIFGHTINKDGKIRFLKDKIAIDCGSYINNVLGTLELKTGFEYYVGEKMEKRILGKTNLNVSVVGLGGIPLQRLTEDEAIKIVKYSIDKI